MRALIIFLFLFSSLLGPAQSGMKDPIPTFTDPRDGQRYATLKIGDRVWMAENINVKLAGSLQYGNKYRTGAIHGRLYPKETKDKICPRGWRLPTIQDIQAALSIVAGIELKEKNKRKEKVFRSRFDDKQLNKMISAKGLALKFSGRCIEVLNYSGEPYLDFFKLNREVSFWTDHGQWDISKKKMEIHGNPDENIYISCRCVKDSVDRSPKSR